jgi:hypothetical protein
VVAAGFEIAPRGTGRARPNRRLPIPDEVHQLLPLLYVDLRMTRGQVAAFFGVPEARVRAWLTRLGIRTRTRGAANREDRARLDPELVERLYVALAHTADEVGGEAGAGRAIVLSTLHEAGLPVRVPNSVEEHVLLDDLYADPLVRSAIRRFGLPVADVAGPLHERFPTPVPLTAPLLRELYEGCGLAVVHIELLTGQPSATVRHRLGAAGVVQRAPGGLSPFVKRSRERHRPR